MNTFLSLSQILLADSELNSQTAALLESMLSLNKNFSQLMKIWQTRPAASEPEEWIKENLVNDPILWGVCKDIILSWCFGAPFKDGNIVVTEPADAEQRAKLWFEGRFWHYAHAHVPGLSGGYFGYWAYPAEK